MLAQIKGSYLYHTVTKPRRTATVIMTAYYSTNNSTLFRGQERSEASLTIHRIAMMIVNVISSLSGIVGNTLVLAVLVKTRDYFQGIHLFIAALAVADLTVCSVVQPVLIYLLFGTEESTLKDFADNIFEILIQISFNFLLTIAIFRVVEISSPFFYRSFANIRRIVVAIVFVCAVSITQGVLFNRQTLRAAEPYFQYATITAFVITYTIIYGIARKHRNIIACQTRSVAFNHNSMTVAKLAHLKNSTITTGIITGVFVVCFLPFSIVNLIGHDIYQPGDNEILIIWFTTIACCNSSMNAYIYTLRSRAFKNAATKILRSMNCFKKYSM